MNSTRATLAIACVAAASIVLAGCTASRDGAQAEGKYINPGAPMAPTANQDWYDLIAREETAGVAFEKVLADDELDPLLRVDEQQRVETPNWVVPVAQTLAGGRIVMGYSLRYDDRIAVLITPADAPMDPALEASQRTIDPDEERVTHPWRQASVRGTKGIARNGTVQRWQSGDIMKVPSALEWTEQTGGAAPYVRYTIIGDVPVGQLQALAARMK